MFCHAPLLVYLPFQHCLLYHTQIIFSIALAYFSQKLRQNTKREDTKSSLCF
nr:MAG TPA: hypothetical protein [Caudoviricetes sp.]